MTPGPGGFPEAFRTLREEGLGYVDAGARDGVHPLFNEAASLVWVVGFEPDAGECQRLNLAKTRWRSATFLPWGLGERDAEEPFHLCRSPGTSSFYRPNRGWLERFPDSRRYEVMETRTVQVRSLDSLCRDPSAARMPPSIDFIKLDTQGAELGILKGSQDILRRQVVGIEAEVEFAPLYEGQPLFRDVDAFLAACGFSLFKLRRKSWVRRNCQARPQGSAGQLIAADALYLRDPLGSGAADSFSWSAHQVEALVLLAALYDLNDLALEVLGDPAMSLAIDAAALSRAIEQRRRQLDYRAGGRGWLTAAVRMARECLRGKAGLSNLYAWELRRSWGRADSDKDFYSRRLSSSSRTAR